MTRANRHHLPGYIWHITHRCHKRKFLLKFGKDKRRCLAYIDLNMVRAGVVHHPGEWVYGGYREIQNPKRRYTMVSRQKLKYGVKA